MTTQEIVENWRDKFDRHLSSTNIPWQVRQSMETFIAVTAQKVGEEKSKEVSEWCTHNAKTLFHNNRHGEYVDVRDLLKFLYNPKE